MLTRVGGLPTLRTGTLPNTAEPLSYTAGTEPDGLGWRRVECRQASFLTDENVPEHFRNKTVAIWSHTEHA